MKHCSTCERLLDLHHFSADRAKKDGLRTKCRDCTAEQRKASRVLHADKIAAAKAEYARKNRAKLRAYHKKWRDENPETYNAGRRAYVELNKERLDAAIKQWKITHRDRFMVSQRFAHANKKAKELGCMPGWADGNAIKLAYEAADLLMQVTGEWYEVDHIVPMQGKTVCGLHCAENLQILTPTENRSKGIRFWPNMPE